MQVVCLLSYAMFMPLRTLANKCKHGIIHERGPGDRGRIITCVLNDYHL